MQYRIGNTQKWLMLMFAGIVDVLEIFASPTIFVAILSGFIQYGILWIWFWSSGVSFMGSIDKVKKRGGAAILESVPVFELLPIFTWSVFETIEESRREDEKKYKESQETEEGVIRAKNIQASVANEENIIRKKRS